MIIREITEESIKEFQNAIPAEFVNEIKRNPVRGLVAVDDFTSDMLSAVFWETKNADDDNAPKEAEICWFFAANAEDGEKVLRAAGLGGGQGECDKVYFELPDPGEAELAALKGSGFSCDKAESRDLLVSVEEISALKMIRNKPDDYVKPLSDLTVHQFKAGIMTCVFHRKYGLLDDLPFLPATRFDQDISCCVVTDEKVNGYLLLHRETDGPFRVELFTAMQPDAKLHLLNMMRFSARALLKLRPKDDLVLLSRHNKATVELVSKLFPGKRGRTVMKGERKG